MLFEITLSHHHHHHHPPQTTIMVGVIFWVLGRTNHSRSHSGRCLPRNGSTKSNDKKRNSRHISILLLSPRTCCPFRHLRSPSAVRLGVAVRRVGVVMAAAGPARQWWVARLARRHQSTHIEAHCSPVASSLRVCRRRRWSRSPRPLRDSGKMLAWSRAPMTPPRRSPSRTWCSATRPVV